MRKLTTVLLCLCFVLAATGPAEARSEMREGKRGNYGLENKCYGDIKLLLMNADDLGLSLEQKEVIKNQKYELKKDKIKMQADIKILSVDISKELWTDDVDVEAVNDLIDRKYQVKAQWQKDLVAVRAAMNAALTDDQRSELRSLRKKTKSSGYGRKGPRKDKYFGKKR